jgi:DNA repair photolyase
MLTKSPLVYRDVDVLAQLARVADVRVYFSITTVDLDLWRTVEPGTANPFKRLFALRALREAGVPAGVLMAPVMPGLTDSMESIEAVASAAYDHKALFFGAAALRLMPTVKEHYMDFVETEFPDLLARYQRAYPGASAPHDYQKALNERVQRVRARFGFRHDAGRDPPPEKLPDWVHRRQMRLL